MVNDQTTGQGQVLRISNAMGTSLTLTAAQAATAGHSYEWWVGAVSINGQAETWSQGQTFSITGLNAAGGFSLTGTVAGLAASGGQTTVQIGELSQRHPQRPARLGPAPARP